MVVVLAQTLQVPSVLTMHAPVGFWGVQVFMNSGHWSGLILPMTTLWHWHPGGLSMPSLGFRLYFARAS